MFQELQYHFDDFDKLYRKKKKEQSFTELQERLQVSDIELEGIIDLLNTYGLSEFINKYPNVIVIKSISKSYGVPGLRLGLLATSDTNLLKELKQEMQVWNINSFAEYYLQIYQLFSKSYDEACDKIVNAREEFVNKLKAFKDFKVYPSEANYVMVDLGDINSRELAITLLDKYKLIIKDLSSKKTFEGKNFIRLAVRDRNDNNYLINCLKEVIK